MNATLPSWPLILTEWGASSNANGGAMPTYMVDISPRMLESTGTKRGKQYELDSVQAGELTAKIRNSDAVLDPTNASSPFAGHIAPFQPLRMRAQYPPTQNLLSYVQATGGEGYSTGLIPASFNIVSKTDSSGGSIVSPGDAYQGSNCFQFSNNATTSTGRICSIENASVQPGQAYSMQLRVRNITPGSTAYVHAHLNFVGPTGSTVGFNFGAGTTLVGSSPGATWVYIHVTGTAPANACGISCGVTQSAVATAANSIQVDVMQLEMASASTAWTAPGQWYPMFSGFFERWPSAWTDAGTFGTITPTVTDALALLSQQVLQDCTTHEVQNLSPRFLYRFDDGSDATTAAEAFGNYPALSTASTIYGPSAVTFGESISSTTPVTGAYLGGQSTVVSLAPAGSTYGSVFDGTSAGISGPANPALYTRMIAFRYTGAPVTSSTPVGLMFCAQADGSYFLVNITNPSGTTKLTFTLYTASGGGNVYAASAAAPAGFNPADGNWHLLFIGYKDSTQQALCSIDGVTTGAFQATGASGFLMSSAYRDEVGGQINPQGGNVEAAFTGNLSYWAEFPALLTSAQITTLYNAWYSAFAGESSATRYGRILTYAGFTGNTNISTGLTSAMGPATDLNGTDALTCLNNVVTTENGDHFAAADGTMTFQGRNYRYDPGSPVYTFGENTSAGEWPYESLSLDFDSTHLANSVAITQYSTGQAYSATDATSQAAYFERVMTRSVNVQSPAEARDCAHYMVNRYKNPLTRVTTLVLNPAANPSLWPVCLSLELGMHIAVNRRPPGCPTISLSLWVEQLSWKLDDKGNATLTLQCSPVDPTPQGQFTSWRAQLAVAAVANANTFTVNGALDMVNPLNSQVGGNQQLVIWDGQFTEVLPIQSAQATGTNWTSGTITVAGTLAYSHAANCVVTEVLPSGVTNPATWDANAPFDSAQFTY